MICVGLVYRLNCCAAEVEWRDSAMVTLEIERLVLGDVTWPLQIAVGS